jgi:pantetheine-phosphate adenylyltransferase
MNKVVCPGTFDPVTNGHLDIIYRAAQISDIVVVGVAEKSSKNLLFTLEERIDFIKSQISGKNGIMVESFDSLVVKFAGKHEAKAIVRGLRAVTDFEHEFQMAQLNKELAPDIETVFIMAKPEYGYLSSSAVKEIALYNGDVTGLVSETVKEALSTKYKSFGG